MTGEDAKPADRKPLLIIVFSTAILGAAIAWSLSTYLFNLSPPWVALLAGAACSLLGFFVLSESIVDAIVFSIVCFVLVFVFMTSSIEIEIVRTTIVPIATGICVGKLCYGIWKEIA
ncbi:MAG: hypothetical protein JSU95_08855 [Betaproteobacteria bacterium]|nr:MAG: hypothetical protein JSU95_08855 [Betaproteobacteria bacterium]